MGTILVIGIRIYQWLISPAKLFLFGPGGRCRFTPTCSAYAIEAIQAHGSVLGCWLAVKRIVRCHPWGGCGHDPVPAPSDLGIGALGSNSRALGFHSVDKTPIRQRAQSRR